LFGIFPSSCAFVEGMVLGHGNHQAL
jgi:hypothetical protein